MADLFAAAQTRVARPSRNYREVVAFYSVTLGFPVLAEWEGHGDYDGTVVGLPEASRQLEILSVADLAPAPTSEDQLVFYLGSAERVDAVVARLAAGGFATRAPDSAPGLPLRRRGGRTGPARPSRRYRARRRRSRS